MRPSNPVPTALNRTRSSLELLLSGLRWLLGASLAGLRWFVTALASAVRRGGARLAAVVRGPVARFARGPLTTLLVGRRAAVSILLVGFAPVLAALTAGVVASTTGYPPLERWLVGTWTGTDPRAAVFVGCALLVGLAAASGAAKGGLLPAAVLTAGPLFGAAVTRYGTRFGERVVSLPEALAFALGVAAVGGVAAGVVGYGLGAGLRRAGRTVRADLSLPSRGGDPDGRNDD